jgi:uncharacterized membrane protein
MAVFFLKRLHVYFKSNNRLGVALSFSASILLSLILLAGRIWHTGEITYLFLVWNLFLALIPLGLSTLLVLYRLHHKNRFRSLVLAGTWLLFFPNAPYILTDLFHLYPRTGIPQWYDLILILSFAWNGLMLGSASLFDMHELVKSRLGWLRGWLFTGFTLALGSFGIYLGRFERWNSWDILQQPFRLLSDIANFVLHPSEYPNVWGMTICYTLLMWVLYATIYQLTKVQSRRISAESVAQNRGKI